MIVIGYPGIGKSTLADRDHRYIDLDSNCFYIDGERDSRWFVPYCNIAEDLSRHGYIVFVSSHESVREHLRESSENVVLAYPSIDLRDAWISNLTERYQDTRSDKDRRALLHVNNHYEEEIRNMDTDTRFPYKLCFIDIDYDLEASLIHLMNSEKIR